MLTFSCIDNLIHSDSGTIFIGYSGGVDSHALLHLLAQQPNLRHKIVALYVDHGLQPESYSWAKHCQHQCEQLAVAYKVLTVDATASVGESPEEAARNARYAAFRQLVKRGDVLLTAQHREDQLETVLLQMFRGAGLNGLSAMSTHSVFGEGALIRPFLNISKATIDAYAVAHHLSWIEDPSNLVDDFDRNFLRNQIIPLLKQRWPSLDQTVSRSARHCADGSYLINQWVSQNIAHIVDPIDNGLLLTYWQLFDQVQRSYLLRHWLAHFGLKPPSEAVLKSIMLQVIDTVDDANPSVSIQNKQIKKYRQKLYCLNSRDLAVKFNTGPWETQQLFFDLANGFNLKLVESSKGIAKTFWNSKAITVEKRKGGERIQLPHRQGSHCLKKLFQEANVPPWERLTKPLIFIDGELAVVPGLWVDRKFLVDDGECYQITIEKNNQF
jgi:tRNA(Ile)-lysidine synthase